MILLTADMSQIESRIELMLAAATPEFAGTDVAKECVRLATAHPSEFDIHRWSAAVCFGKSEREVKDTPEEPERHLGKTYMYGFQRGMGAGTAADTLLKQGIIVTPEEVEQRLARLANKLPAIPDGFFPDVRRQFMRYRALGTTWGGIFRCDWQRLEEHLYAVGYSYQPQHETVSLVNQRGLRPLRDAIALRRACPIPGRPVPVLHVHGHDSLTLSVHPDDAWSVMAFLDRTLGGTVRRYAAGELRVPVTYSIGHTWKADYEFKRLPDRHTVREAAWACEEKGRQ